MNSTAQRVALPSLRQELSLQPAQAAPDGSPTWTLHDPACNRFYQLGWPAFEILSRWSLHYADDIVAAVRAETTLQITHDDVAAIADFLLHHHLCIAASAQDSAHLARVAQAQRPGLWRWLLHHYLFIRIPLFRPQRFLDATAPLVRFVFDPRFWWAIAAIAGVGLYLVAQRWDSFRHSFTAYAGWQGLVGIGIALSCAKVLHELGHAYTAHRHGCRVPTMGVGFLVMVPVLYTDTNEAWKLASRRARLQIAVAGMAAELALAACATLLWNFLPDGPLRAGVFLLATSTWLITLALNLSPFMRFDGYFVVSDLLNMPNLHERAFALARWRLREWLFDLGEPVPEVFAPGRQRFLIAFAWATWLYRLTVFLGIGLLVYHVFFKLLGALLLSVELGWFIALPFVSEFRAWWVRRRAMRWNRATRRSAVLATMLMAFLLLPLWGSVRAPAMLEAERAQIIYAPAAAQVKRVLVAEGASVKAGQLLVELVSPELELQLAQDKANAQQLRWQLEQQSFDPRLQASGTALQTRWEAARDALAGAQALQAQLQIRAPFDGRLAGDTPALKPGTWIPKGEPLLQLASGAGVRVEAFVDESALPRLAQVEHARFIADQPGLPGVDCRRAQLDRINIASLEFGALASSFGGPIPSALQHDGSLQPMQTLFRVRLDECAGLDATLRELPGSVSFSGQRESLAGRLLRRGMALWQREAGL